ncbi:556_t:CDS:2 [Paraglomus brasilianum]|uniref:556_t:CDS:1 n=1 Tax=Paraglomus brasilianum TaxID=144538 RepID=A0A9N8WRF3_9GLOM|nr:556_t:CDS:2 [Paraglomus brasilianum]
MEVVYFMGIPEGAVGVYTLLGCKNAFGVVDAINKNADDDASDLRPMQHRQSQSRYLLSDLSNCVYDVHKRIYV